MRSLLSELCLLFDDCSVYELGGYIHDENPRLLNFLHGKVLQVNYTWMRPRRHVFKGFSPRGAFEQCVINCGKDCCADFMLENRLVEYYRITLQYPWLQCVVGLASEDCSTVVNPIELLYLPSFNER